MDSLVQIDSAKKCLAEQQDFIFHTPAMVKSLREDVIVNCESGSVK